MRSREEIVNALLAEAASNIIIYIEQRADELATAAGNPWTAETVLTRTAAFLNIATSELVGEEVLGYEDWEILFVAVETEPYRTALSAAMARQHGEQA